MATNFRVSVHRNSENLHLILNGDFDGTSAHQLLNIVRRYSHRTSRVFIHTSCLGDIHPFGLSLFHNLLDALKGRSLELIFTGAHAPHLAPRGPLLFDLTISTVPPAASPERTPPCPLPVRPEQKMEQLERILIKRLEQKGIEPNTLPGFMRDLANSVLLSPDVNLVHVNQRLHLLGWESVEMDYHTLQLAIACFEAEGLKGLENKLFLGFESSLKPHDVSSNR